MKPGSAQDSIVPRSVLVSETSIASDSAAVGNVVSSGKRRFREPFRFMAHVHGGIGINRFFGDVVDREKIAIHTLGNRPMFTLGIGANLTGYLELSMNGMYGWLNGNENTFAPHRNFQAEVFGLGADLLYNFRNLMRSPLGITPFVSLGAMYSDFRVFGDLKDATGNTYHFWDDGLIRNAPQAAAETSDLRVIYRDYNYETRLSQGALTTLAVPIGVGFDINASRKVAIRFSTTYFFTATDAIDNVISGSKGLLSNDGWLTTSLAFHYRFDPFYRRVKEVEFDVWYYTDFADLRREDADGDGVPDLLDVCSDTPKGVLVDAKGCPLDRDGDGVPDFLDEEPNTPKSAIVDSRGVTIDYDGIYQRYRTDSAAFPRSMVTTDYAFYPSEKNPKYTVHVGTFVKEDMPSQLRRMLSEMPGLVERRLNDSTSVFTVGVFGDFADAQAKQNELRTKGIAEAFGATERAVQHVALGLGSIYTGESYYEPILTKEEANVGTQDEGILTYGVELRGFRLRVELDKLSRLIASHGVEMRLTDGSGKILYVIGSATTYAAALQLQQEVLGLGVKNAEISAKLNNRPIDIEKARVIERMRGGQ